MISFSLIHFHSFSLHHRWLNYTIDYGRCRHQRIITNNANANGANNIYRIFTLEWTRRIVAEKLKTNVYFLSIFLLFQWHCCIWCSVFAQISLWMCAAHQPRINCTNELRNHFFLLLCFLFVCVDFWFSIICNSMRSYKNKLNGVENYVSLKTNGC